MNPERENYREPDTDDFEPYLGWLLILVGVILIYGVLRYWLYLMEDPKIRRDSAEMLPGFLGFIVAVVLIELGRTRK